MSAGVYGHLFEFVHRMEEAFEGEPSFPYIVTTTTRPPELFLHEPWIRLQLEGTPAQGRLLKMDL